MKSAFWMLLIVLVGMTSCEEEIVEETNVSSNEFAEFFYPYDTIPKIYVFRNIVNGIEEEFHRVFSINDSKGKHIVVEVYKADGRITEALNYNLDSLNVIDHMVVDRNMENKKAELLKNKLIPDDKKSTASFASRFAGIKDSTMFLKELDRKFSSTTKIDVLDKQVSATIFNDYIRMTLFNPFTKEESVGQWEFVNYFASGYGLVEWHTPDKSFHYRLEKIISQDEFVNLMSK
ncbi:MAG: hypothetical protein P8P74_08415 [Crocinitomicaceae bacterium]|nr:hypothetical protein [Crocinitomicaceae bacterium]